MKTKTILILILSTFLISSCLNQAKIDKKQEKQEIKEVQYAKNESICIKETGMKTQQAKTIRDASAQFIQYLLKQDYETIKPYLSDSLQKQLEAQQITERKLDIFLPGASKIIPLIENFNISSLYKIETNPESNQISGLCQSDKGLSNNLVYNFKNPEAEMAGVLITGNKAKTFANIILTFKLTDNTWKIDQISLFPGGIAGRSAFEIYQYAAEYEKENKNDLSYLLYDLISIITPKNSNLLPEYLIKANKSMNTIKTNLPKFEKNNYQNWQVTKDYSLLVFNVKAIPIQDKPALSVSYITLVRDITVNDEESLLIKEYIKKTYPDLAYYFRLLITEATLEIPKTRNYQHYAKLLQM